MNKTSAEIPYRCSYCDEVEHRPAIHPQVGTNDESARIAGWRIGERAGKRDVVCPECAGTDPDYWDRVRAGWPFAMGMPW